MNKEVINFAILSGLYLALFGVAELLYHRFKWQAEHTRKLVHAVSGLLTLLFPILFSSHWWVIILCGSFLLILLASKKWGYLKSINGVDRKTHGSELFPIAVYLLFLNYTEYTFYTKMNPLYFFYQPILVLAICDPMAALVGKRLNFVPISVFGHKKTIGGSLAFLLATAGLTCAIYFLFRQANYPWFWAYLAVMAILTTTSEFISTKGFDNFVIVLVATSVNYVFYL